MRLVFSARVSVLAFYVAGLNQFVDRALARTEKRKKESRRCGCRNACSPTTSACGRFGSARSTREAIWRKISGSGSSLVSAVGSRGAADGSETRTRLKPGERSRPFRLAIWSLRTSRHRYGPSRRIWKKRCLTPSRSLFARASRNGGRRGIGIRYTSCHVSSSLPFACSQ